MVALRNGDRLSGTVEGSAWRLETAYGAVAFAREQLAGIRLGVAGTPDVAVLRNGDVLGGRLERTSLRMVLAAGPAIEIDPATVHVILFRLEEGEPPAWPAGQYVRLRSGEVLTGRVGPESLTLRTPTGEVSLARGTWSFLGPANEDRPFTRVVFPGDETLDGELANDEFVVELAAGPTLKVRVEDLDFLMGRENERPREPETLGGVRVVRVGSTKDVNVSLRGVPEEGGLRVVELSDDSPFQGALRPGDLIVKVAGGAYGEGVLTRATWDMLLGNREYMEVGFLRDGKADRILLMRGEASPERAGMR